MLYNDVIYVNYRYSFFYCYTISKNKYSIYLDSLEIRPDEVKNFEIRTDLQLDFSTELTLNLKIKA